MSARPLHQDPVSIHLYEFEFSHIDKREAYSLVQVHYFCFRFALVGIKEDNIFVLHSRLAICVCQSTKVFRNTY